MEKKLTDEEIAEEIVKALVNTKKSLEDLNEDDDDYDKLSLVKKINNSSLWLIHRLQDENAEQKAEIERLNKCVMSEVQVRKCCEDIIQDTIKQTVNDMGKEIYKRVTDNLKMWLRERYDVEVE